MQLSILCEARLIANHLLSLAALALHQGGLHPDALVGQRAARLLQDAPRALHLVVLKLDLEGRQPDLLALCTSPGNSQRFHETCMCAAHSQHWHSIREAV